MEKPSFDVVILGAGLAGTTLGTILAHHRHRVLLLERGSLPRFAIGESTLPQTSYWMWTIGAYHGLPEIQLLSRNVTVRQKVSPLCGIKRSIAFVHHREGEELAPDAIHQLIAPETPFNGESHLFREAVDYYMLDVAKSKGVTYRDKTEVEGVDEGDYGLDVRVAGGERIHARYVVDTTGHRSPLAHQFELRDEPPDLETHSRTIFTHCRRLRPFDELIKTGHPAQSAGFHQGTLHHVFDGGWFWVIPFGNYDGATNDLASVGLMLDPRKSPSDPDRDPAEEFFSTVDRFPTIAAHLRSIEPSRPWVATDRIQYTSRRSAGDRWFVLGHAHGFIDPLYSRGLLQTYEGLHLFAIELLDALRDDDLSAARMAKIERLQHAQIRHTDREVSTAYRCMTDFSLWSPWTQLWLLRTLFADFWRVRSLFRFVDTGDPAILRDVHEDPIPGAAAPFSAELEGLVESFRHILDRFEAREIDTRTASAGMHDALKSVEWLPRHLYRWGSEDERHIDFDLSKVNELITWGKTAAPEHIRARAFDMEVPSALFEG